MLAILRASVMSFVIIQFSSSLTHFIAHIQPNELIFIAMFIISEVIRMTLQLYICTIGVPGQVPVDLRILFVVPRS